MSTTNNQTAAGAKPAPALGELIAAAEKITLFGQTQIGAPAHAPFTGLLIPNASAVVCDDEGGPITEADHVCVGAPVIFLDVQRWSERGRTGTAAGRAELADEDAAEEAIIRFGKEVAADLGLKAEYESNVGSGEFGRINQLRITPKGGAS